MSDVPQASLRSRFWLIVSLCLNFFLIGLIVAGLVVARNRAIAGAVQGEGSLPPEVIVQLLPQSGTVKMCSAITSSTDAFIRLGRELVDARRDVFKAFRAQPFDAAAFKTATERATAAQVSLVQLRQAIALQVTQQLSDSERQELSRKLVRRFFSGGRGERLDRRSLRELCAAAGAQGASQPPR